MKWIVRTKISKLSKPNSLTQSFAAFTNCAHAPVICWDNSLSTLPMPRMGGSLSIFIATYHLWRDISILLLHVMLCAEVAESLVPRCYAAHLEMTRWTINLSHLFVSFRLQSKRDCLHALNGRLCTFVGIPHSHVVAIWPSATGM